MANPISAYRFTFFLFSAFNLAFTSSAMAVAKDQVSCSMCSSCDNPCQPQPPPPPLIPTSQCPPPPPPPSCDACIYASPPPPSSVQPYTPTDGGQFSGLAPPPPNPILPYFPYYYYNPPSASIKTASFSWKMLPLGFLIVNLIIICL